MKKTSSKPCWNDYGLTYEGANLADKVYRDMESIVKKVGRTVAQTVLKEAIFRIEELPTRDAAYRNKYLKDNK